MIVERFGVLVVGAVVWAYNPNYNDLTMTETEDVLEAEVIDAAAEDDDDWSAIPTASAADFFNSDAVDTTETATTPPTDSQTPTTPAVVEDATQKPTEGVSDDDFWGDAPADADAPVTTSKGLRGLIAEQFGVQVADTDDDEAVVSAVVARLQAGAGQDNGPLPMIVSRLALEDKELLRQHMLDELAQKTGEFETADEIEEELERLEDRGVLERKAAAERKRLEGHKERLEADIAANAAQQQAEYERMRTEFATELERYELKGVKLPPRQMPVLKDFIESGKYMRQMQKGVWEDGTPMTAKELVEQAIFAHKVFKEKFINRLEAEAGKKAVSEYIKKLENRAMPTETGGYVPSTGGIATVGHKEFFG